MAMVPVPADWSKVDLTTTLGILKSTYTKTLLGNDGYFYTTTNDYSSTESVFKHDELGNLIWTKTANIRVSYSSRDAHCSAYNASTNHIGVVVFDTDAVLVRVLNLNTGNWANDIDLPCSQMICVQISMGPTGFIVAYKTPDNANVIRVTEITVVGDIIAVGDSYDIDLGGSKNYFGLAYWMDLGIFVVAQSTTLGKNAIYRATTVGGVWNATALSSNVDGRHYRFGRALAGGVVHLSYPRVSPNRTLYYTNYTVATDTWTAAAAIDTGNPCYGHNVNFPFSDTEGLIISGLEGGTRTKIRHYDLSTSTWTSYTLSDFHASSVWGGVTKDGFHYLFVSDSDSPYYSMQYSTKGSPFPAAKFAGVDGANIASVNGIASSDIAKIAGI